MSHHFCSSILVVMLFLSPVLLCVTRKCCAGDIWVPVDKRAVRICVPGPNMQGVERGETEAILTLEVVIKLAHKLRRAFPRMLLVPLVGQDQKVGPNQSKMAVGLRFVNYDLRFSGINDAF